jgi:hypothetical protein
MSMSQACRAHRAADTGQKGVFWLAALTLGQQQTIPNFLALAGHAWREIFIDGTFARAASP